MTRNADADHAHYLVTPYATSTLGSPAANITFSAIPGTYAVLRLLIVGASASATEGDRWGVQVNADTGNHYDLMSVEGIGGGTVSGGGKNASAFWISLTSPPPGDIPGASATAGVAGILEIEIPNYAGTTFQKTGLWRSGYSDAATSANDASLTTSLAAWRSTAAITSISVFTQTASNLVTGTAAYLYLT